MRGWLFVGALLIQGSVTLGTVLWCREVLNRIPSDWPRLRETDDWAERGVIIGFWLATFGVLAGFALVTYWLVRLVVCGA